MTTTIEMADALKRTKHELTNRFFETTDGVEKQKIERELNDLERKIDKVVLEGLNEAAARVANAADDLMDVVQSARTGALDSYLQRIWPAIAHLRMLIEDAVDQETGVKRGFPKTEDPETAKPLPPLTPEPVPPPDPVQVPRTVPQVIKSTKFADLKDEYEAEWANCQIRDDKRGIVEGVYVAKLNANKDKYQQVAEQYHGMPWFFIGVIHAMETGFRFDRHLHNGDPLSARTVRVPKGRPISGNPPFSWEFSAKDSMEKMGYERESDWSLPHVFYLLEKYNGFGYRFKGMRTPYLWSYSNLYSKGRYVADGVFDPNAVSKQCGAATMLKALI